MAQSQIGPTLELRPPCPQCAEPMMITRIEPVSSGIDERTFQCNKCNFGETALVSFR